MFTHDTKLPVFLSSRRVHKRMSYPLLLLYPSKKVNITIDSEEGRPVTHRKGFTFRCH